MLLRRLGSYSVDCVDCSADEGATLYGSGGLVALEGLGSDYTYGLV